MLRVKNLREYINKFRRRRGNVKIVERNAPGQQDCFRDVKIPRPRVAGAGVQFQVFGGVREVDQHRVTCKDIRVQILDERPAVFSREFRLDFSQRGQMRMRNREIDIRGEFLRIVPV